MPSSNRSSVLKVFGFCFCLVAVSPALLSSSYAQDVTEPANAAADNTSINQRDRSSHELTADQAGQHLSDRQLMQQIRKSVIGDKSLSTYAHNIKIIAAQGKVTLKGPVRTEDEKQNVLGKAADVAGNDNVVDQISVKQSN